VVLFVKRVWYSLKNGWDLKKKNKLPEGDARITYENELPFHM